VLTFDVSERYFEPEDSAHSEGTALLDDLASFVRRYVVLRPEQADTVALWIVHSHAADAAETTPYLAITSPEKRSGKSRLLEVLGRLVARPLATANISDAALFRAIAAERPTLLFDEVDAIFGKGATDREDLRGLLNAGWRRGQFVHRIGGAQKTTLEAFEVFSPKALAGIGAPLPDTVADRSITISLKRKAPGETVERFRRREVDEAAEPLQRGIEAWAEANLDALAEARPEIPDVLDDRAADGWEPLLAIADRAGGKWPERARQAALTLSAGADREDDSLGVRLLADCRRVFGERDRLATAELLDGLAADDEAPWADWHGRGRITARGLARLLKPYGISSRTIRLDAGETPKGYLREQFEDAWSRYLPSEDAPIRHNATTRLDKGIETIPDPPQAPLVADTETAANPHGHTVVADVADTRPLPGDVGFREQLNHAHDRGHLTGQERFERRLLHDLVWRARAA
jgi:hypothetical protein